MEIEFKSKIWMSVTKEMKNWVAEFLRSDFHSCNLKWTIQQLLRSRNRIYEIFNNATKWKSV
jgi:hypothetical protein